MAAVLRGNVVAPTFAPLELGIWKKKEGSGHHAPWAHTHSNALSAPLARRQDRELSGVRQHSFLNTPSAFLRLAGIDTSAIRATIMRIHGPRDTSKIT